MECNYWWAVLDPQPKNNVLQDQILHFMFCLYTLNWDKTLQECTFLLLSTLQYSRCMSLTKLPVRIKLHQFVLINSPHSKLALDCTDEGRTLKQGTNHGVQNLGNEASNTHSRKVHVSQGVHRGEKWVRGKSRPSELSH